MADSQDDNSDIETRNGRSPDQDRRQIPHRHTRGSASNNFQHSSISAGRDQDIANNITASGNARVYYKSSTGSDEDTDLKILNWLSNINFQQRWRENLRRVQSGTGHWFLHHNKYVTWKKGAGHTLWCKGQPGAGKTMLMSLAAQDVQKFMSNDHCLVLVFFSLERDKNATLIDVLGAMLRQVAINGDTLSDDLHEMYKTHQTSGTTPSTDEIQECLTSELDQYENKYFVIDALDEASVDLRGQLMEFLISYRASASNVHILASSRDNIPSIAMDIGEHVSFSVAANTSDLEAYIDKQARSSRYRRLIVQHTDVFIKMKTDLIEKSKGMFLLVSEHLKIVQVINPRSKAELEDSIRRLPNSLDDTYRLRWCQINEQEYKDDVLLARQVFSWLCYSFRPLTVDEMRHAIAAGQHVITSNIDDYLYHEDDLIEPCLGFVAVVGEYIDFVHPTAREYFPKHLAEDLVEAHEIIVLASLRYLTMPSLEIPTPTNDQTTRDLLENLNVYSFLPYALQHWKYHYLRLATPTLNDLIYEIIVGRAASEILGRLLYLFGLEHVGTLPWQIPHGIHGIHLAAFYGLYDILRRLIDEGVEIDITDSHGCSAVRWSIYNHEYSSFKILLEKGADVDVKDHCSCTTLLWALRNGHERAGCIRLIRGTGIVHFGETYYIDSARRAHDWFRSLPFRCHPQIIETLIRSSSDINASDAGGVTALAEAARNKQFGCLQWLLDAGADVDITDNWGATALLHLLRSETCDGEYGDIAISGEALLHIGNYFICDTDSNVVKELHDMHSIYGTSKPLEIAVQWLTGRNVDARDYDGMSAVDLVAASGMETAVKFLIDHGADVSCTEHAIAKTTAWCKPHFAHPGQATKLDRIVLRGRARLLCGAVVELGCGETRTTTPNAAVVQSNVAERRIAKEQILRMVRIAQFKRLQSSTSHLANLPTITTYPTPIPEAGMSLNWKPDMKDTVSSDEPVPWWILAHITYVSKCRWRHLAHRQEQWEPVLDAIRHPSKRHSVASRLLQQIHHLKLTPRDDRTGSTNRSVASGSSHPRSIHKNITVEEDGLILLGSMSKKPDFQNFQRPAWFLARPTSRTELRNTILHDWGQVLCGNIYVNGRDGFQEFLRVFRDFGPPPGPEEVSLIQKLSIDTTNLKPSRTSV